MIGISIFLLLVIVLFIGLISLAIYTFMYNKSIEAKLKKGDKSGIQWPEPKNIVLVIMTVLVVVSGIINLLSSDSGSGQVVNVNQYVDYATYTSKDIVGSSAENYVEAFEKGELKGYKKEEKTENNFHYIYFVSEEDYDILHPSFILFVEYVGEKEYKCYMDEAKVYLDEGNNFSSSGGGENEEYYVVVGNIDLDSGYGFKYEMGMYEDEAKMEKEVNEDCLKDASERVSIIIEK
ncbi:MAG: hypothetical protein IJA34_06535 [Lachnospiraceae bacterium]|nr:hypothetical protein [Lachnospiraceae bacterium]